MNGPLANGFLAVMVISMSRWLKRGVGAILAVLVFFIVGSNLWVWSAGWGRLASKPSEVPVGAVMVVLGTDEFVGATGERTGTYRPRIDAALELARSGRVKLIVTSGTDVHARVMATQLRAAGVTCPIVEDPYGWRTLDSVLRAKAYYPEDHVVFVSQGWHCVRALWLLLPCSAMLWMPFLVRNSATLLAPNLVRVNTSTWLQLCSLMMWVSSAFFLLRPTG